MCPHFSVVRRFMARNILKRFLPNPAAIKSNPALQFLGDLLHHPNLFHLNRHSVSLAFFWGLLIALLPVPGQMAIAAGAAVMFHCNLGISCALVWVSNPFTMPFFFYIAYTIGRFTLQIDPIHFSVPPEFTWEWVSSELPKVWYPLLLPFLVGSVITGLALGILGYFGMQVFWRWNVVRAWEKRKRKRLEVQ